MPKGQRRVHLRMDVQLHHRVSKAADALGVGLNDLINLLVRRALGPMRVWSTVLPREHDSETAVERRRRVRRQETKTRRVFVYLSRQVQDCIHLFYSDRGESHLICGLVEMALPDVEAEVELYANFSCSDRYSDAYRRWRDAGLGTDAFVFDVELRKALAGRSSTVRILKQSAS